LVDPKKGIHVLLDVDKTHIVELSPFAFSQLLAHQAQGVPEARMRVGEGVWAFPSLENRIAGPSATQKAVTRASTTVVGPRAVLADPHAETVTNSIGLKLKLSPAGEFHMGSTERDDEKPRHLVKNPAVLPGHLSSDAARIQGNIEEEPEPLFERQPSPC
jgi:hypothetical protein